jgi:hypothetical protein
MGLATLWLVFAAVADATPVEPDMKELLANQPPKTSQFAPARAGWYPAGASRPAPNLELESFSTAHTARAAKAALRAAAVPHPLAIAGILGMIFLLRRLRTMQPV